MYKLVQITSDSETIKVEYIYVGMTDLTVTLIYIPLSQEIYEHTMMLCATIEDRLSYS